MPLNAFSQNEHVMCVAMESNQIMNLQYATDAGQTCTKHAVVCIAGEQHDGDAAEKKKGYYDRIIDRPLSTKFQNIDLDDDTIVEAIGVNLKLAVHALQQPGWQFLKSVCSVCHTPIQQGYMRACSAAHHSHIEYSQYCFGKHAEEYGCDAHMVTMDIAYAPASPKPRDLVETL